ncbi:MAG: glycosyltransferase family 4 protein [Chloroflexi bacterium]|nr:glycosyltransferase family 4 protein [Chloroflexota bacterium]
MSPLRALFLVPWPEAAASTRLRAQQYFPYLRAHGVEPVLRPFMSADLYGRVYESGHLPWKVAQVVESSVRRLADLVAASRADVVFVHREAFPFGLLTIERIIRRLGVPMVLDFDDAIYLPSSSEPNGFVRHLKNPRKVQELVRMSTAVVVGNDHLQEYARQFNPATVVIPTPVDADVYRPAPADEARERITIGWIGSGTTSRYLDTLAEPLARILQRHDSVDVAVVGGRSLPLERLPRVSFYRWTIERELALLQSFNVGLMPYPDNEWARGKCAFKALLYMSVGIPVVCSPVGMAEEVVTEGVNGYLPSTEADWYAALESLVEDAAALRQMGAAGRNILAARYSLERHAPRLLAVLQAVTNGKTVPVDEWGQRSVAPRPDVAR